MNTAAQLSNISLADEWERVYGFVVACCVHLFGIVTRFSLHPWVHLLCVVCFVVSMVCVLEH